MIDKTTFSNSDDVVYHVELEAKDLTFDGEKFTLHLTHDEMQYIYFELKEEVLHNS